MLPKYHVQILREALSGIFSPVALNSIIQANLHQDRLLGQIGHDEYHFDNNAFEKSYAYIEEQRMLAVASLKARDAPSAWSAFGRLTHTAQDFYAHSNYIDLWLSQHRSGSYPSPFEIDPIAQDLTTPGSLRSGKVYLLEIFSYIPPLRPLIRRLLPRDSHAWMNLDSPEQGFKFDYGMQASIKRTVIEFKTTTKDLRQDLLRLFVDQQQPDTRVARSSSGAIMN